jgi:hypothetical protein
VREVMNGIMYVLSTGCQWRAIPKDLPPRSTVHDYLDLWSYDGTLDRIHHIAIRPVLPRGDMDKNITPGSHSRSVGMRIRRQGARGSARA